VAGPDWANDDPADTARVVTNVADAAAEAAVLARTRGPVTHLELERWHSIVYRDCTVPSAAYVGHFRGEPQPDLADYEVGVGLTMPDGYPDGVGVWAADVAAAATRFFASLQTALAALDGVVAPGTRPTEVDVLHEVIGVVAAAHGEWIRIHPFVNGNGRTARVLAAHLALRYGLPIFVTLKPRPHDVAYARVARASMGRPPDFTGDHTEATSVFTHLLALQLLGP
jgi:fido (protein-threonine AMPylation protein)